MQYTFPCPVAGVQEPWHTQTAPQVSGPADLQGCPKVQRNPQRAQWQTRDPVLAYAYLAATSTSGNEICRWCLVGADALKCPARL